ncbi:MAG: glutamine--tRNA ligase/YqeY domain fusion protein [Acidimicrobiaceae bacterium]|nr:glutamine--tRNA ligase/YqeY domain fusion protein [Acidimicrobiaceae bacterium]
MSNSDDEASAVRSNSGTDFIREMLKQHSSDGPYGGRVQTRFPPEPNGFLHIGHAKSITLNFGVADEFGGECRLRFDDTNPETEDARFVDAIQEDLRWFGIDPGEPAYASDYFDQLHAWAVDLIEGGLAYVDDQDAETISENRGGFTTPGTDSPWRDRRIAENRDLFAGMKAGEFAEGERVLRAKIDMNHENMQMRDPVMYRIRHQHHFRTGDEWKIYPTYDWAHGQSDAIEGTTHSLCTLEFDSHRPLYDWYHEAIGLGTDHPRQTEFARLNLTHTVMSKRKLLELVEQQHVDGWDDARMPTLRGLRRRGYPAEAIRDFCGHIGIAKVNGVHEIELLESFVRTRHNRHALRRMAVLDPLEVVITNWPTDANGVGTPDVRTAINNPEDETAGTREVPFSGRLFIERDDFRIDPPKKFFRLAPGREVRLRAGYFITCDEVETGPDGEITRLLCSYDPETAGGQAPDGRKVKATMHWVSAEHALDVDVALYERLFTDEHPGSGGDDPLASLNPNSREVRRAKAEAAVADIAPGQVVQFERLGYFARDLDDDPTALPTLFHRTVGLRDEWANIQKRQG